jgi:hypothetical protein
MAAGKKKKGQKKDVGSFDTHVVLYQYPARRAFLLMVTVVLSLLFAIWLWACMRKGDVPWYLIGLPMIFIGMLANFIQPSEEWQYTPWQAATQKYEKNIYD